MPDLGNTKILKLAVIQEQQMLKDSNMKSRCTNNTQFVPQLNEKYSEEFMFHLKN